MVPVYCVLGLYNCKRRKALMTGVALSTSIGRITRWARRCTPHVLLPASMTGSKKRYICYWSCYGLVSCTGPDSGMRSDQADQALEMRQNSAAPCSSCGVSAFSHCNSE